MSESESKTVVINPDPPVEFGEDQGEGGLGAGDFNQLPQGAEGTEGTEEGKAVLPSINPGEGVQGPSVDPNKVLELGDRILIVQEGDKISVGTVYYRSGDLLRLKTDGDNTKLIDFPREYTENEDRFNPDLGVTASYILQKHINDKFTEQQRFQAGMILQGWVKGEKGPSYKITQIYTDRDAIEIENVEDAEDKRDLEFDYCGIPLNEEFDILNIAGLGPVPEPTPTGAEVKEEEEAEEEEGEEEDEEILNNSDEGNLEYVYVPVFQEVEQVDAAKERITEEVQKNSALSDFVNMLPPKDQQDPLIVRDYRILVEVLNQMKNDITDYEDDGTVRGVLDPSVSTLVELIKRTQVSNGRPIFKMKKRLYIDPKDWTEEDFNKEDDKDAFYKANDIKDIDNYNARVGLKQTSKTVIKGQAVVSSRFYEQQQELYKLYGRPWAAVTAITAVTAIETVEGNSQSPLIKLTDDVMAFRNIVPDGTGTIKGYIRVDEIMDEEQRKISIQRKITPAYPLLTDLYNGAENVLSTTYRKGKKGGREPLLASEANTMLTHYLLFPNSASRFIGSKRSGSLAIDTTRAFEKKSVENVIRTLGFPEEMASTTIITLNVNEGILDDFGLADYINGIYGLKGVNMSEFAVQLEDLGASRLDYNEEVVKILQSKMTNTQAQLKLALKREREAITTIKAAEPNPILQIDKEALIRGRAILKEALAIFERQNHVLKESDVAFFVYMLRSYGDYFQATLGGQETIITREEQTVIKTRHLVEREITKILRDAEQNRPMIPTPNTCKHVPELKGIRTEDDTNEFHKKLGVFLTKYQGLNTETWIDCKVCKQHLLCAHERQMIKGFLYPNEMEAIQKDLHLHFSGGLFQGHYICRICGQPMEDLEYENTLQFDDQGRPMNGNAPLIDEDELNKTELEDLLNLPLKDEGETKRTEEQNEYFYILKDLALNVGLNFKSETYNQLIQHLKTFATTNIGTMANFKPTKPTPTYETYKYRFLVTAAACLILIEAQSATIEYVPFKSLPDCSQPEFGGYPLNEDKDIRGGLTYMACSVGSLLKNKKNSKPWSYVNYTINKVLKTQQESVENAMTIIMGILLDTNQILGQRLARKREQISETTRVEGSRFKDKIPSTFLPNSQLYKGPIDKAVAESTRNARNQSLYWLKSGDALAKENASNLLDPLAVSILCCRSPVNKPETFWTEKQASLVTFTEGRFLVPVKTAKALQPHFTPRPTEVFVTEIPDDKLYALFLKVCYQGERVGYSHEPDINHTCIWCGFQFGKPYSLMNTEDAIKAVAANKITTDMETYQALLDKVHVNYYVEMPALMTGEAATVIPIALADFTLMDPPPIAEWSDLFTEINTELKKLVDKESVEKLTLAEIMTPLSNVIEPMKAYVREKYNSGSTEHRDILRGLDTLVNLNWTNFIQVLETYFLKPAQNLVFNYSAEAPLSYKNGNLADTHMTLIKQMIRADRSVNINFTALGEQKPENSLAHMKLELFVRQMSLITSFRSRINPSYFVGREQTFKWFKETFVYGPLATLYNPEIGYADAAASKLAVSETIPAMIGETLLNFMKQRLTYDDEQVKLIIADSAEKEKQAMLKWLKSLTEDERRLMQVNKVLKLNRFAVGADWKTFAVYSAQEFRRRTGEIKEMAEWGSLSGESGSNSGNQSGYHEGLNQHADDN